LMDMAGLPETTGSARAIAVRMRGMGWLPYKGKPGSRRAGWRGEMRGWYDPKPFGGPRQGVHVRATPLQGGLRRR
jgi:hypothetical protein